ncbi:hypothetical protein DOTSEDRAFT_130443 [Dothistroma septosporum NZE10]|uniref:Uncharacterized protein n=1 Tax=Dothistroma septosporum (strain NZE10 / CBS 128990) TaxID=675120 RepID=N1PLR9_DOTSN|nr:hypothetical protein DOTSEDRAFT_130443 [Dothistroma septosporum NZE10]
MYAKIAAVSFAALAAAAPLEKRQSGPNDGQILNYALTLEYLENEFYKQGLANYTAEDFQNAGALPGFYDNLKKISSDESTHVSFLTSALDTAGVTAVQPCTYAFGATDAASFLQTAAVLEAVGVSAYLGAAQLISTKDYLTAAGSILTVEARHSAYLNQQQAPPKSPFPSPFDVPLDLDEVYSLAAQFIVSCPPGQSLPVKAFPILTVVSPTTPVKEGDQLKITTATSVNANAAYFITINGPVKADAARADDDYYVIVPAGVQHGQEYLVFTSTDATPTDDNIVAVGIVNIQDNLYGKTYPAS